MKNNSVNTSYDYLGKQVKSNLNEYVSNIQNRLLGVLSSGSKEMSRISKSLHTGGLGLKRRLSNSGHESGNDALSYVKNESNEASYFSKLNPRYRLNEIADKYLIGEDEELVNDSESEQNHIVASDGFNNSDIELSNVDENIGVSKVKKGNIGNWIGEQWNDIWDKGKWSSDTGNNVLRTAGFAATGVGAVALAYQGLKKLFGWGKDKKENDEKTEEKKEKTPFWETRYGKTLKRTGIGAIGYYVAHGAKTGKWDLKSILDWYKEGEEPLTVEESLSVAEGEVNCGKIDENLYRQNFDNGIDYDINNQSIVSYGESTQIDVNNKCIIGLGTVKFKTNTELVHAANIVNCLKYNFRGKGGAAKPFGPTERGGDIEFCFSEQGAKEIISGSDTDFWKNLLTAAGVLSGGAIGLGTKNGYVGIGSALGLGALGYIGGDAIDNNSSLGKCCSTIKEGSNFYRFIGYLNDLQEGGESLWLPGKQEHEPEGKSPIQKFINESMDELDEENRLEAYKGKSRDLKAEKDPKNPNRYKITSFGHSTYIKLGGKVKNDKNGIIDPSTIKSITIEQYSHNDLGGELDLHFPNTAKGLKECLKIIDLTNKIRNEYPGKGGERYPIFYNQKDYYQGDSHTFAPNSTYEAGLRIDTNGDITSSAKGVRLMTNEDLSLYYPTLLNDLQKSRSNSQEYFEGQLSGKRKRPGSSYIKFLNGMRTAAAENYWTHGQKV